MSDKKNIDQLFKDRFKDFEAEPSAEVWKNIQSQMAEKKEDRKVIPLWWKLGGVAALLALLLTVGNAVFNPFGDSPAIVNESIENTTENNDPILTNGEENRIATEEDDALKSSDTSNEGVSEGDATENFKTEDKTVKRSHVSQNAVAETTLEANTDKKTDNRLIEEKDKIVTKNSEEAVAINSEEKQKKTTDKVNSSVEKSQVTPANTKSTDAVAAVTKSEKETSKEKTETTGVASEERPEAEKQSIFDAIEETETAVAATKKKTVDNRWEVAPNFAPVYYNSLSEGSSIDPMFADNSQSGDVNFSYGVQVSYNITDKLSVRSGLSNVDLSYATGDVEIGTGPVALALRSIDYGNNPIVTIAADEGSISNTAPGDPFANVSPKAAGGNVQLVQNIKYYEVPLELKYALLNNKVGINVLGGFSTLFLGSNEVAIEADNLNEVLGEANNLSNVSFTTNVGLGFDYKISKKFKFNIEPMFKYQLNPYTDSSVDFRPYYLGVYTGFSLRF